MLARRTLTALAIAGTLLIAGCSDDADDAGTDDGAPAADDNGSSDAAPEGALTTADRDAFIAAIQNGTTEGETYVSCVAGKVKDAVDAGDLTAQDVRDWTEGRGVEGPVNELMVSTDVVVACSNEAAASTTVAP